MKKLTDDEFEALCKANDPIRVEGYDDDEIGLHVAWKVPNFTEWTQYKRDVADPETRSAVVKKTVGWSLVYPTAMEFDAYLNDYPATLDVVMREIGESAGVRYSGVRKKRSRT